MSSLPIWRRLLPVLLLAMAGGVARAQDDAEASAFQRRAALFSAKCTKCHTIGKGDRVGPDLKGVTDRRPRAWLQSLIARPSAMLDTDPVAKELLAKYNNVRMEDLSLTKEQVDDVLAHIDEVSKGPATGDEPVGRYADEPILRRIEMPDERRGVSWAALFIAAALALGSFFLRHQGWRGTSAAGVVLAICGVYCGIGEHGFHRLAGDQQGYEPVQPIAYSHETHAGKLGIACLYCHHGAEKGPVAGLPSVNICMNCHRIVKNPDGSNKVTPELAKLEAIWETRNTSSPKSIEWVRVHNLADFVFFNHRSHVQNSIQCQECHGPVETMVRLRQASDLSMGWCVACHRKSGKDAPSHWKRSTGPLDCSACHQ
ncbi:MAG: c-type cytochrome [Planctomycetota bacterium]